jgi:hypothetical protein
LLDKEKKEIRFCPNKEVSEILLLNCYIGLMIKVAESQELSE